MLQKRFSIENGKLVPNPNGKYDAEGNIIREQVFIQNYSSGMIQKGLKENPKFIKKLIKGESCTLFRSTEERRNLFARGSFF